MYMHVSGDRTTHEVSGVIDAGRPGVADQWLTPADTNHQYMVL